MRFIIQLVLFVAICVVVFPGFYANPLENGEQAVVVRNEGDEGRWWSGCVHFWIVDFCAGSKSKQMSPECRECVSNCESNAVCAKFPENERFEIPECKKCITDCADSEVCNV